MRTRRLSAVVASLVTGLLVLSGCGSGGSPSSPSGAGSNDGGNAEKGSLTVLAPADVLATADTATMKTVSDAGNTAGKPRIFATNHLQLVVPRDNPAGITKFADLDRSGVKYVVCVDTAPCGKLAKTVLEQTGITHPPASEEVDVKAVETKVQLGEADAGIVYATDAVAAGDKVKAIDIPTSNQNLNSYPIAALENARKPALAADWVRLVLSGKGQKVLSDDGFGKP
jgi:molybdate transport system substrate-binding protein